MLKYIVHWQQFIYLKLDSLLTMLPWIETEDWSSAAAVQQLAEGLVGPEYWDGLQQQPA